MPTPGEVRINGLVFINNKPAGTLKSQPPQPYTHRPAAGAETHTAEGLGAFPKGKPGQLVCVFQGSGEAADVPKSPDPRLMGSGGHGRLVCKVDGKTVIDEPASNVTKPEIAYKRRHKNWRGDKKAWDRLRQTNGISMPAPPGTYKMSKLGYSSSHGRHVIHLNIPHRELIEIHSVTEGTKAKWWDTDGCIRVAPETVKQLGDYLKHQTGVIQINENPEFSGKR